MYKELNLYYNTDKVNNKELIIKGLNHKIDGIISCPTNLIEFREIVPKNIKLICMVDYPYGLSGTSCRQHCCIEAIKHGASDIDLVINHHHLKQQNITAIKKDIAVHQKICDENKVNLRIMLESRICEDKFINSSVRAIYNLGLHEFLLSTGMLLEDYLDNLTMAAILKKKMADIKVICTANIWYEEQYKKVLKSGIYGVRLNFVNNLNFVNKSV